MTSQHTTIYTPFTDGRPVRDFVEHTPALVDETWCRKLLRHTLDSLEQQYATGAPHRPITPDTLVMLENGEALMMPSPGDTSGATPGLPADLHALALVVHYAITAELPPDGPLGPRLYDNYSEQLTKGLDCCLGPNRRLRPQTVDEMRSLLGIEATAEVLEPAAPAPLAFVAPPAALDATPLRADSGAQTEASIDRYAVAAPDETAPGPHFAAPATVSPAAGNPVPEPAYMAPAAPAPAEEPAIAPQAAADPLPAASEALSLRERTEAGILRKPASEDGQTTEAAPATGGAARAAPAASALHASNQPAAAAPFKPSAAIPPGAPGARRGPASGPPASQGRGSRAQRWGMMAGAAIVVLAAGGAIVSYLEQNDARAPVPLSLPPAERAATGLDTGETVVAPPAAAPAADQPMAAQPVDSPLDATTGAAPDSGAGLAGAAPQAAPSAAGGAGAAIINGTTYKLVIKPWGTLYVNGVDHGVSPPVKRLTLGPGRHTIQVVNPNFPEHTMTVDAGLRETAVIKHDFRAQAR